MLKILIFLTFATYNLAIENLIKKQTLFEINADRVEQMEANLSITDWSSLKIRKISRTNTTRAVFGNAVFKIPFSDEIEIEVKIYKKQGGEYRLLPYRVPRSPICTFLAADFYAYPDLARFSDFPLDIGEKCPLPPQNFSFNGFIPDYSNVPKVMLPSGDSAADTIYYYHDELILRWRAYVIIHNIGN